MRRLGRREELALPDAAIAAVILCVGSWLGVSNVRAFTGAGGRPSFYQSEFGPAVLFACGRGLTSPDPRTAAVLAPFLDEQRDAVDCGALPERSAPVALDAFQRTCRYLELTVGLTWKLTGVSWQRLSLLNGILFGAVAALSYGIFRLGLGRILSSLGVIAVLMSTPNLSLAPHLRDYAKGPFLLAVMLVMGVLVVRPAGPRRMIALSALAGAVVGFGLGFRTDLMIALLPFIVVVAFVAPAEALSVRAAAIAAFLAAFVAAAAPILGVYSRGNNIGPVALLGLTAPFDAALRIEPSLYEYGAHYNDSFVFSIVNSYAVRVEGKTHGVQLASPEHASASMAYLAELMRTLPADFVTRALAACRTTARYFLDSSLETPAWLRSRTLATMFWMRGAISSRLAPLAIPALIAATIGAGLAAPRAAWLIVVLLAAFAGGSAIQFNERHFFYLQFLPWWAFGFLLQATLEEPAATRRAAAAHWKHAALFVGVVTIATAAAVFVSREYQQRSAAALFARYEGAPRERLAVEPIAREPDRVRLAAASWNAALPADAPRVATRVVAVQFDDRGCTVDALPLTIRYEATLPELDFSETLSVPLAQAGSAPTMLFFATFDRPDDATRFRGVEVAKAHARCVAAISAVQGLDRTPLLLTTMLPADWRSRPLYQRLR